MGEPVVYAENRTSNKESVCKSHIYTPEFITATPHERANLNLHIHHWKKWYHDAKFVITGGTGTSDGTGDDNVGMITSGAASDDRVGTMRILSFQCCMLTDQNC